MAGLRERIARQGNGRRRPRPPLPATLRLDRHRGPGREPMASDLSIRPRPVGFGRTSDLQHSSPRTVFQITPWQGAGLSGQWRRNRTFDSQIMSLMLYQTELSVVQTAGIEPATSGPKSGALPLSYIRDPNPQSGAVYRAAEPSARAETKAPTVVLASVFVTGSAPIAPATGCRKRHCRDEFAASFGGCISATPACGCPRRQKVTRPSTRRPSPCGSTTTASPSRGETPVSATMFSRWVTMTRLSEPE